jgi:hypothetical protein
MGWVAEQSGFNAAQEQRLVSSVILSPDHLWSTHSLSRWLLEAVFLEVEWLWGEDR